MEKSHLLDEWSGTVVCVTVESEADLYWWASELELRGQEVSIFREPDIGDQLSCIAVLLNQEQAQWLCRLPLAGSCGLPP